MKVIVIRQPWEWLIVNGYKDIKNRSWVTRYRGPLLIQASASLPTKADFEEIRRSVRRRGVKLPDEFQLGGIVGKAELVECVTSSRSKWFEGPVGWVLEDAKKLLFMPLKGQLGLFDPPRRIFHRIRHIVGPD